MLEFMKAGGYGMWFELFIGVLLLGTAGLYLWRPREKRIAILRVLSWSMVFAILCGVTSSIAALMRHVTSNPEWASSPDRALLVMVGLGESMAPAILGFALLAVTWLLVAAGLRRAGDVDSAC